jgi:hypothetical protein
MPTLKLAHLQLTELQAPTPNSKPQLQALMLALPPALQLWYLLQPESQTSLLIMLKMQTPHSLTECRALILAQKN